MRGSFFLFFATLGVVGTLSCQTSPDQQVLSVDVNVEDFASLIDTSDLGLLLDVRTDAEFIEGHLKGATQLNFYEASFEASLDAMDKNIPVFVYCRSGGRSGKTAKKMKEKGFKSVYNLEGGIIAWQREHSVVK
jgi:rhodanese-related sulfurtransferase|tara:strand:- start:109 stop:510 length:402 start_codon:yes stop_codon:yes gene_type:complete